MTRIDQNMPLIIQVTAYYPPHLGGMENCVANIAEGLANKGYTVKVFTSNIGYSKEVAKSSNFEVHYLKSIELAHTPVIFGLLFRLLSLPNRSLIHLHIGQAFSPEIVFLAAKLRGIPYIAHLHLDVDPSGPFGFLLDIYKRLFLNRVLRAAGRVICLTEPQKKAIALKYGLPLESINVVPNGVDEIFFVEKYSNETSVPHLLFVGRLVAQKNLLLLIEAVAQMQTNVYVDIVGEGELSQDIEALIQKHQLKNIQLHGKKTGEELLELYRAAAIFMLPSIKEGISLAMLEALAAGLPVVASDLPEIRQFLDTCGVLIQNPTATSYAKAVDALLADRDTLRNLSILSVQRAHSYSWNNILKSIEDVYGQVTLSDVISSSKKSQ